MTAAEIARALHGRKVGSGYMACCPAHDDRTPSLSIRQRNGKILVHCHAGCPQPQVIAVLGDLGLWISAENQAKPAERIVAIYDYTDENGDLLYQIVRKEPGKRFLCRYPDGRGNWVWRKYPKQVLYHLPEVIEAPIVFVVEGEKDTESLRAYGFVATTNPFGADAKWLPEFTESLRGREVNIIPDNDEAGWKHATAIARALLGAAARIRILDLPRDTKDISEWFSAGHSECELIAILEGAHAV